MTTIGSPMKTELVTISPSEAVSGDDHLRGEGTRGFLSGSNPIDRGVNRFVSVRL